MSSKDVYKRQVIRTVVVGTAGDSDGHLIGIVIGHHYHIGTRLAGAVRAVRAERSTGFCSRNRRKLLPRR